MHSGYEVFLLGAARKDARVVEVEIRLDDAEQVAGLTNLQVEVKIFP